MELLEEQGIHMKKYEFNFRKKILKNICLNAKQAKVGLVENSTNVK